MPFCATYRRHSYLVKVKNDFVKYLKTQLVMLFFKFLQCMFQIGTLFSITILSIIS